MKIRPICKCNICGFWIEVKLAVKMSDGQTICTACYYHPMPELKTNGNLD